jgi:hypothetical protein
LVVPEDAAVGAISTLAAAAKKPKALRRDTLIWKYRKSEHLVPADESVVPWVEKDRLWRLPHSAACASYAPRMRSSISISSSMLWKL